MENVTKTTNKVAENAKKNAEQLKYVGNEASEYGKMGIILFLIQKQAKSKPMRKKQLTKLQILKKDGTNSYMLPNMPT